MAKKTKSLSFKNFRFVISEDELTNEKRVCLVESTKDDDIWTDFQDVLEMFQGEDSLSMTIKVEKGFNE